LGLLLAVSVFRHIGQLQAMIKLPDMTAILTPALTNPREGGLL
jgi:hypothetical protein